jgi:hypothetical protein
MCRPQGDFRSLGAVLFGMPHRPHIIPASKVAISKSVHQQAFPIGPISPLLSPFLFNSDFCQLFYHTIFVPFQIIVYFSTIEYYPKSWNFQSDGNVSALLTVAPPSVKHIIN